MTLNFATIVCAALLLTTSGFASAGVVWQSSNCTAPSNPQGTRECYSSGSPEQLSVELSGWSASSTGKFNSAKLVGYTEGFGITRSNESGSPQHAIDNNNGTDAILMHFNAEVVLNRLATGWAYNDADISILRYTGDHAPVLGASKVSNLLNVAGWELVGNFHTLQTNVALDFNADGKSAAWWLVSAYNSAYTGIAPSYGFGNGNDYFKLKSFQADILVTDEQSSDVPEPASWTLLGIAMLGVAASRRKAAVR